LESLVPAITCPRAIVPVLSAERTFWEKATLIHAECNRGKVKDSGVARMSRHWYDLAQLAAGSTGPAAVGDKYLLADVVLQKTVLYYSGYSNYEACLNGDLSLVPQGELAAALEEDFESMKGDGMFWQSPGSFEDIVDLLAEIETEINEKFSD